MKFTIILMALCVVLGTFFNFLTIKRYIQKKRINEMGSGGRMIKYLFSIFIVSFLLMMCSKNNSDVVSMEEFQS